jgi:ferredoxin
LDEADRTDAVLGPVADDATNEEAEGKRGPIIVEVEVEDHKIKSVNAIYDQDTVSIGGNAVAEMERLYAGSDKPEEIDAVTGATATSFGVMNAVRDALWKGVPDAPQPSPISDIVHWLMTFELHMITFNTFAILFIVVLFFDYTITSALVEGTGQSLNCMDCQTCVGACPVKMVEGHPFPMAMVLRARLGDYDTVMSLSKYCVGCSKCSAKCPVGISAPSIAGAVAEFLHKQGRYEEAKFFEERIEEEKKVG